jgi:chemotaxis protein histidine kinase CheA
MLVAWRRILVNMTKSFDDDFKDDLAQLQCKTEALRDEVQLAHMRRVEQSHGQLQQAVHDVRGNTGSLECQARAREVDSKHDLHYWRMSNLTNLL